MWTGQATLIPTRRILWTALAVMVFLPGAQPARATDTLREELAVAAANIRDLLKGRNESAIAIGGFSPSPHLEANGGPGLDQILSEELKKLGIAVNRRAPLQVKGDYFDVKDKKTQLLAALLKIRVLDNQGTIIVEFERGVKDQAALPSLFGLTAELPPAGDPKVRDQELKKAIDNPRTAITSTHIAAAPGSPFAIEVLVKAPDGKLQPGVPKEEEGLAFVPIKRGEVYGVRLINNADHAAAVTLTIDGLNLFTFSDVKNPKTGLPKYTVVVVEAHKTATIRGWHRTNEVSEEFLVTEYAKSAAAQIQSTGKIGVITAVFAAAWPKDAGPPADEPKNAHDHARSGDDATGRGAQVTGKFTEVVRQFGVPRATVTVRYTK